MLIEFWNHKQLHIAGEIFHMYRKRAKLMLTRQKRELEGHGTHVSHSQAVST